MSAGKWSWWAGRNEEEFTLAGPCRTREQAIDEARGETEPGEMIFLVEAIVSDEIDTFTDLYPFLEQRNASQVIREEDACLATNPRPQHIENWRRMMSNGRIFCIAAFLTFSLLCTAINHGVEIGTRDGWSEPVSLLSIAVLMGCAFVCLFGDRVR